MKRLRASAGTGMNSTQINAFRDEKVTDYGADEISGVLVIGEGHVWIELEGDNGVMEDALDDLQNDSRLSDFNLVDYSTISTRVWDEFYAYYKTQTPKST